MITNKNILLSDSLSSLSSSASLLTGSASLSTGSLLSSIAPPSALPSFVTSPSSQPPSSNISPQENLNPNLKKDDDLIERKPNTENEMNKQLQQDKLHPPSTSTEQPIVNISLTDDNEAPDSGVLGAGLFSWVKETVANNSVLSRVAEKAKNSVNSMITTLDPQMREFICK